MATNPPADGLFQQSIAIILNNQSPGGAYLACPNFPTYQYSWFRDGAFIAYAMDLVGEHNSARHFHGWVTNVINHRAGLIERAIKLGKSGGVMTGADYLHTRYSVGGEEAHGEEEWPNYQLDGFGTWLWALNEHLRVTGISLPETWNQAAISVAEYLTALWARPCYDCWEEFPERVHSYTLAAVYAGLRAHTEFSGCDHRETLQLIEKWLRDQAIKDHHFVKFNNSEVVDANLIGLSTPYRVVDPGDAVMRETVSQIESTLVRGGGVHRYPSDSYYGGGEWVLLAAWLGWYYTEIGEFERAQQLLRWIEAQVDSGGNLPEQVPLTMNDGRYYEPWVRRWGPIASPLLWSHAKYIILRLKLLEALK